METKLCPKCGTEKPISDFYLNKGRSDGLSGYCVECQRQAENDRKWAARLKLIADLGGCCQDPHCRVPGGMDDPRCLQIDHVNGDGAIDRIEHPNTNSAAFYKAVRANPDRYMLICANCNWIKRHERGEVVGRRVYTRTSPTKRKQGPGRHNPKVNTRRSKSVRRWNAEHPKELAELAEKRRQIATGRRLVVGEDGKRHWVYPDQE